MNEKTTKKNKKEPIKHVKIKKQVTIPEVMVYERFATELDGATGSSLRIVQKALVITAYQELK